MIGFPIHMILCYLNIYILMPVFLYRKKYILYTLTIITALFLSVLLKYNLTYYLVSTNVWPEGPEVINNLTVNYAVDMMIGELYVITFVTAIIITMDWLKKQRQLASLEKQQLETELRFLRTQVSPHFFFNTLNNIYALTIEKPKKASKSILRLSELMRYLLYETKQKRQPLDKEILCLQNYLDLERIRYGELLRIHMDISGDIEDKEIAPMLLLSFVENAFKHGANKNVGIIDIHISFKVVGDFLYFSISNPMPAKENNNTISATSGGVGLGNVSKRLSLGYQEDEYELTINKGEKLYVVELKIKVVWN